MRATTLFLLAAMTVCVCAPIGRDYALAAEDLDGDDDTSVKGQIKGALPDWFDRQSREYFTLPPFNIPVISDKAVTRQITLLVTLETMGLDNKDKVIANRRYLQDSFMRDMYGVLAFRRSDDQGYPVDIIQTRLRRVSDQLLGQGVIDSILVKETYERDFTDGDR